MDVNSSLLSRFIKLSSIIILMMIIFIDSNFLNSLVVYYEDELVVEEVNVSFGGASVKAELMENVVVNDEEVVNSYASTMGVALNNNWAWPTNGNYVITSYYGNRWGSMHQAIDISGTGYGSNIYAANNGVVVTAKGGCVSGNRSCNGRGGNYIVIKHNVNNYYTVYMHLKDIRVRTGDVVSLGQVIGTMGNTGNVYPMPTSNRPYNGTHLHFALYIGEPYKGGYPVNPMRLY